MTFESHITAFSRRFLSDRTFELVVSPAIADFEYEAGESGRHRARTYLAVLRAVGGGMREEIIRESGAFLGLVLLPVCYFAFMMVLFADVLELSSGFLVGGVLGAVLSFGPVMVCYWPERQPAPPAD